METSYPFHQRRIWFDEQLPDDLAPEIIAFRTGYCEWKSKYNFVLDQHWYEAKRGGAPKMDSVG